MATKLSSLSLAIRTLRPISARPLTHGTPRLFPCHSTLSLSPPPLSRRAFSSTPPKAKARTVEEVRSISRTGPFTLKTAVIFLGTGAVMVGYFQYEKARMERKRITEMSKGYGKPKVGGPFELVDLEGRGFTHEDLKGKYSLIYFGFTHCPDICPDELDKLSAAIDILQSKQPHSIRPIFVSVDPARDSPPILATYLSEFHPAIQGLTGTWSQIKEMCRVYRVYFSTPKDIVPEKLAEDYLVDHSIYFYVMDPEGDFVECIGRQDTPESAAGIVLEHIKDWRREGKKIDTTPLEYLSIKEGGKTLQTSS